MTKKNLIFNKCPVDYSERKKKQRFIRIIQDMYMIVHTALVYHVVFEKKNALITTSAQLSCYICKSKY